MFDDRKATGNPGRITCCGAQGESQQQFPDEAPGVFVNWWRQIRYDLKTIVSTGWHHSLIPDDYLVAEFFQVEADAIEALEATIAEAQGALFEAVETALDVSGYEPDHDEKVTAAAIKKALKALIDDLKDSAGASVKKELKNFTDQDKAIKVIEKRIKDAKAEHKQKQAELELKLELKRLGADDFKTETQELIAQADARLVELDPKKKVNKKTIAALNKDKEALSAGLARTGAVFKAIGGKISEADGRRLILKKIYDLACGELDRYLNSEKRLLVRAVENLWEKYAVSNSELETERNASLKKLDEYLHLMGYVQCQ